LIETIAAIIGVTIALCLPLAGWLYEDHKITEHINKRR
jgi:hypothetical protein